MDAKGSLSMQIGQIETLLNDPPQYLVLSANKSRGFSEWISRAADLGVKVALVDCICADVDLDDVWVNLCYDAEWAGTQAAHLFAQYAEGAPSRILEIQSGEGAWYTNYIVQGFRDALCLYDNLQIDGVITHASDRLQTSKAVLNYIQRNEGEISFDAVLGHTGEDGMGAVNAFLSFYDAPVQTVPIVCIGGESDVQMALETGRISACIYVSPNYGEQLMRIIAADQAGNPFEKQQLRQGEVYTLETCDQMRGY